jgi:hypothetical protein
VRKCGIACWLTPVREFQKIVIISKQCDGYAVERALNLERRFLR